MNQLKFPFYARLAFILISTVLTLLLLVEGKDIFVPLVFGLLIAILLYPMNKFFEQRVKMGRSLAAMCSLLIFIAGVGAFLFFFSTQIVNFSQDFPDLKVRFQHIFADMQHYLSRKMHINNAQQNDYINKSLTGMLQSGARSVSNLFVSLTNILLLTVFVLIFAFFMLFHHRMLMRFAVMLFSIEHKEKVSEVLMETKSMINSYVVGLLTEMVIMSIANSTVLLILGVQYAVLLGVLAAVLNIIPYIGMYSSIGFIMLVTFANSSGNHAIEAGIGMFVLHLLDSNILMPRIVGARVKMNPFITIVAVIVGEFVWGIPGMFLFIPIVGITKLICERVEGMEAWGLLIGVDEVEKKPKEKLVIKDDSNDDKPVVEGVKE